MAAYEQSRWFAEEVLPHQAHLRAWLQARFPALREADDVVQEAVIRVMQAHDAGPIVCPRAFLFITARNLALNRLRRDRFELPTEDRAIDQLAIPDGSAGIPESIARSEELRMLVDAIQSLPERCRQVVTLRKIYGVSQREAAERLGVSEATIETQVAIGVRKCAEYFRRRRCL